VRALILDGQLVDVGDLVLHDAGMDVRHPTHELTRAASALRARRTALVRPAPGRCRSTASRPCAASARHAGRGITYAPGASRIRTTRTPTRPSPMMPIRGRRTLPRSTLSWTAPTRF
jgi:hypothetical protein